MFDRRINFVLDDELYILVQAESKRRRCSLGDVVRERLSQAYAQDGRTPMPEPAPSWTPEVQHDA